MVFDNFSTGRMGNIRRHLRNPRFSFLKKDLRDREAVGEAVKGIDAVFHLAAVTSVPFSVRFPGATRAVNVDGTRNILEACSEHGVRRLVFASSCAVYGEPRYLPINEKHPTNPLSPYAESKLEAERLCMEFSRRHNLSTVILRFFNVYSLRSRGGQYGGVVARFAGRLGRGKPPVVYGDCGQTRDFLFVGDAVEAMMLALGSAEASGGIFNIGSGSSTAINDLASMLAGIMGVCGVKPVYRGARPGDIRHSYSDVSLARKVLGFKAETPIEEGLARLAGK